MPDDDGYDLMERLRRRHPNRELRAAALTAYARGEDTHRALRAGYRMHIPKPIDPDRLIQLLTELVAGDAEP